MIILKINYINKNLTNDDFTYRTFNIKKRKGGHRKIDSPSLGLMKIQRKLKNSLENEFSLPDYVTGFCKGKNIVNNASFHTNKQNLINIDIKDFFNSISNEMIYKKFKNKVNDINLFLKLVTNNGYLPQGSPVSPIIANIIFNDVDKKIINYLENNNFKDIGYSRYADDISISFDNNIDLNIILNSINKIIKSSNFIINENKISFYTQKSKMQVTGLVVNKRVAFPKYNYRIIRSVIYKLLNKGYGYFPHIKGILSFLMNVDKKKYNLLKHTYGKKFSENSVYYELFDIDYSGNKYNNRPIDYLGNKLKNKNKIKIDLDDIEGIDNGENDIEGVDDWEENELRGLFPDWGSGSFSDYLQGEGIG